MLFGCSIMFGVSCGEGGKNKSGFSLFHKTELATNYPEFDVKVLKDSLKGYFSDSSLVSMFYQREDFLPCWTENIYEAPALDSLLFFLEHSYEHGVDPERFDYSLLKALTDTLRSGAFKNDMPAFYHQLVLLEKMATKAYLQYNKGLRFGFVNPKKLFPKAYYRSYSQADSSYLIEAWHALKTSPVDYLKESQPMDVHYRTLQKELLIYNKLKDSVFEPIPKKAGKNYPLNSTSEIFPLIAKRLSVTNQYMLPESADSSSYESLTPELLEAVNAFRRKMSYPEDNEIGDLTIDALNRPLEYYFQKLQSNLERLRWKGTKEKGDKFIEVNVAAFLLQAVEKGNDPLLMNVCVGKAGANQIPLLESDITYVNLNPKWNVPPSIAEKEIYWSVKKKPDYLTRNNMKLIDRKTGNEMDFNTLNWDELNPKQLPFRIQQASGNGNSLGRIKFMFENPFAVYLHDTPSKSTFSRKNRAVSHGCVRVQKPVELAFFCFEKRDSIFMDRVLYTIDQSPKSTEGKDLWKKGKLSKLNDVVNLDRHVPVFIDYYTSYVLPDGEVYFADDVYNFDEKILSALASSEKESSF